jgi:hypothetical protein
MNPPESTRNDDALLHATLALNAKLLGTLLGLMFGVAVFVATNWLVLQGGPVDANGQRVVGPHLALLGQYFLGYSVSFVGSLIGFAYAFVLGFLTGYLIAWLYNRLVRILGAAPGA